MKTNMQHPMKHEKLNSIYNYVFSTFKSLYILLGAEGRGRKLHYLVSRTKTSLQTNGYCSGGAVIVVVIIAVIVMVIVAVIVVEM